MIKLIEKKQLFLIKKAKYYLKKIKNENIDTSKSAFCFLNSFSPTPGYAKIIYWLNTENFLRKYIFIIFTHIISIARYSNYILINKKNQKFQNILVTWGRRSDFVNGLFYDRFTNSNSNQIKKTIIFLIYLDKILPKKIPNNVIILYNKKKFNCIFFLKTFSKLIFTNIFSLRKFFHYFSAQTVFAEIVNENLSSLLDKNEVSKIILPYEGQPFQNFVIKNLKKRYKSITSIGFIHSMIPALPLNFIKRDGSPDMIYLSGDSQRDLFVKYLGWKKKDISIIDSVRIKKKMTKFHFNSIFFAMYISHLSKILIEIENFLRLQKKKSLPLLDIKKHPQMLESKEQLILESKIKELILDYKEKFNFHSKINHSFHVGPTSAFIQYLENNKNAIHFTILPELDLYTNKLWKKIIPIKLNDYSFGYKITAKRKILRLSNSSFNILKANIL
tara:strand:+ start:56 stop:1390 length:1335 start_codon:yes stop_codon:yes gene_type:complete